MQRLAMYVRQLNGHEVVADRDELYELCVGVAGGKASKADAAVFFARHLRRHPR